MRSNSINKYFGITTFGESHSKYMGLVIEDVRPQINFPFEELKKALSKRKPGQTKFSSTRKEDDTFEVISGVFEGKTTGMPICILFSNQDAQSKDYENLKNLFRPGHADYSWWQKFKIFDYRGGGRSSGRETIARVAAGAYVQMILGDLHLLSYPIQIGTVHAQQIEPNFLLNNSLRWPDHSNYEQVLSYLEQIQAEEDSVGACVELMIKNMPTGLGDPVFEKLDANLAKAIMSIGGVKGIAFGSGFSFGQMKGSEANDQMTKYGFRTNHQGGVAGGVSNGNDLVIHIAIKPVSSIGKKQKTITFEQQEVDMKITGRHDLCLVPRILPVLESMVQLVLADAIAYQRLISGEAENLNQLREIVDHIDQDILIALYRRMQVVKQIGNYKQKNNLPLSDLTREKELLGRINNFAEDLHLSSDWVKRIWQLILNESKKVQEVSH